MGDLLIQKTVPAEECERFANALTGRECRCDPSKLYTISVKAHGVTEQHQGEPVALPGARDYHAFHRELDEYVDGWNACLDEIAKLEPLYTHADPGEVARLRGIIRMHEKTVQEQADHLAYMRAQLADRDALLRDVQRGMREYEQGCDQFPPFHHNQLMERIDTALSAGAEPSVPKIKIRVPEGLVNCIEGNRVFRSDEKLVLFRPEEFGAVGDGVTDDTEAFRACVEAAAQFANPAELTDEQIIEVMHTHLNNADGGYVVDTAPGDVVKAGRALLAYAGRSAQVEIDERAEFESTLSTNYPDANLRKMDDGNYAGRLAYEGWKLWQARAALEKKS